MSAGRAGQRCGKGSDILLEQHVTIELFGQPYTFKTQSELSQAREVADFLVREVTKVSDYYPNKSDTNDLSKYLTNQKIEVLRSLN